VDAHGFFRAVALLVHVAGLTVNDEVMETADYLFNLLDEDGSGTVDFAELATCVLGGCALCERVSVVSPCVRRCVCMQGTDLVLQWKHRRQGARRICPVRRGWERLHLPAGNGSIPHERVPDHVYVVFCACRVPCAVCRVPCAVCRVPCAVCRVPCSVCRVPCAVCRVPQTRMAFARVQTT
jgi:hypothetical protein